MTLAGGSRASSSSTGTIGRPAWIAVLLLGTGGVLLGTFLPWLRSGSVWRSSYQVWEAADRLGVIEGGPAAALHAAWFLLPLGSAGVLVAVAVDRAVLAAAIAAAAGLLGAVGSVVALLAPLPTGMGPIVTLAAAAAAMAAAAAIGLTARRRRAGAGGRTLSSPPGV